MKNIVLIGMPGVGKSTIGVVLAKKLGYAFLDCDLHIQEQTNMLLHEIIEKHGQEGFNEIENRINASIEATRSVIATGGSAVYGKEAMEHFKEMGTIVYLSLPYEELKERLGDLNERGVSMKKDQTLLSLYEERKPLYEKYAELTIDCHNLPIRLAIDEILKTLAKDFV